MNEFLRLGLSQSLVETIEELGFEVPTPIQSKAIPRLLEDDIDFVGLAQTGTGKTAAFGLPLIDLLDVDNRLTQALILAPTRELCIQITKELNLFSKRHKSLKIKPVYGGTDIIKQIKEIKKGAHIIVATPGRLRDLIRRKAVNITRIEYVILDEADEMLNMGFKEEIDDILKNTPEDKLTWLFSATMPQEVRQIARNYMSEPLEIRVGQQNSANADISHQFVLARPSERYECLRRFLDYQSNIFGLIFTRTRRDANDLAEYLTRDGYRADALHGDLTQAQRDRVMGKFRDKRIQVLVATDVAARGIDVQEITHVFHYNIPDDISFYTHRSGRTGRAGSKGISLVFAHPKDKGLLARIERKIKIKFEKAHIPTGQEICEQRILSSMNRIVEAPIHETIEQMSPQLIESLEELTKEELLKKVASLSFARVLKKYKNAIDLNRVNDKKRNRPSHGNRLRLFINIGTMDVGDKSGFLSFICKNREIPGYAIGKINMHQKFTFFEVEEDFAEQVIRLFKNSSYQGRSIRVNNDVGKPNKTGKRKGKKKRVRN